MALIQDIPKDNFGHNRLVGFTDDGFVWLVYDCRAPGGEPMQMREIMTPKEALAFSKNIIEAAGKAHQQVKPLIIQPGAN